MIEEVEKDIKVVVITVSHMLETKGPIKNVQ